MFKVNNFELNQKKTNAANNNQCDNEFCIKLIPRSREVKQSYLTAILTTLYASWHSLLVVNETR